MEDNITHEEIKLLNEGVRFSAYSTAVKLICLYSVAFKDLKEFCLFAFALDTLNSVGFVGLRRPPSQMYTSII